MPQVFDKPCTLIMGGINGEFLLQINLQSARTASKYNDALPMCRWATSLLCVLFFNVTLFAQTYTIRTYAGPGLPLDGSLATAQAIDFPYAVISDAAGAL